MRFTIASAGVESVETIVEHRRRMFFDMGHRDVAALDAMSEAFRPWLRGKMQSGEYLAWFAVLAGGEACAGVGLWLMDWPPHLIGAGSRRGNVVNVYTSPEHRRQGIARALVETALTWSREHGIVCVILHASSEGRALYEGLGFHATNEMRILL
jgi:ribosomal protein S18 acetylase RimI-like enzyme